MHRKSDNWRFTLAKAYEFVKENSNKCNGRTISGHTYSSLRDAKDACKFDSNCAAIYDVSCDNIDFKLCPKGFQKGSSSSKSCIYNKQGTIQHIYSKLQIGLESQLNPDNEWIDNVLLETSKEDKPITVTVSSNINVLTTQTLEGKY